LIDIGELERTGWVQIEGIESKNDLLSIAEILGTIKPHPNGDLIFCLTPSDGKTSVKGTFSNVFGYSDFPLHTDTAFWSIPARYLVLGMFNQSDCHTQVIRSSDVFNKLGSEISKLVKNSIYMINTLEGKKYASLYFKHKSQTGFKFDSNCMKPVNIAAKLFHSKMMGIFQNLEVTNISWSGNKAIILDNWVTLHGRETVPSTDINRQLFRVYIG